MLNDVNAKVDMLGCHTKDQFRNMKATKQWRKFSSMEPSSYMKDYVSAYARNTYPFPTVNKTMQLNKDVTWDFENMCTKTQEETLIVLSYLILQCIYIVI